MKQFAASLFMLFLVLHGLYAQPLPPDGGHGASNDSGSATISTQLVIHDAINVFPGNQVFQLDALGFIASTRLLSALELHIQTDSALVQIQGLNNTSLPGNCLLYTSPSPRD